jgi:hypothetical protein
VLAHLPHALLALPLQKGFDYLAGVHLPCTLDVADNALTGEVPPNLSATSISSQAGSRATLPLVLLYVSPPSLVAERNICHVLHVK